MSSICANTQNVHCRENRTNIEHEPKYFYAQHHFEGWKVLFILKPISKDENTFTPKSDPEGIKYL